MPYKKTTSVVRMPLVKGHSYLQMKAMSHFMTLANSLSSQVADHEWL